MSQLIYSVYEINNKADLLKQSGIYRITNVINNKCYIGSSVNIYKRWLKHIVELNTARHNNQLLFRSWNKYGSNFFDFEILGFYPIDQLIEKEQYFIEWYDSYLKGYNLTKSVKAINLGKFGKEHPMFGKKLSIESLKKKSNSLKLVWKNRRREYKLLNPEGKIITINNLSEFCKNNNLTHSNIRQVLNKERSSCCGYKHPDFLNKTYKVYLFVNPKSEIVEWNENTSGSINKFSLEYQLDPSSVYKLIKGKIQIYKNWKLKEIKEYELFDSSSTIGSSVSSIDGKE